jgi:hypothetical protein
MRPHETCDWREEEYRFLYHNYQSNDGCRYWQIVNVLAKQDTDYGFRVAQRRYAALRQRLVNEKKLVRIPKGYGYRLLVTDAGVLRLRELAGVSSGAHPDKTSRYGNHHRHGHERAWGTDSGLMNRTAWSRRELTHTYGLCGSSVAGGVTGVGGGFGGSFGSPGVG